jgi:hypothetical protein
MDMHADPFGFQTVETQCTATAHIAAPPCGSVTARQIGIYQYYNLFISLAITATAFPLVSILIVPNA